MNSSFKGIQQLLIKIEKEGRRHLLEPEVYSLFKSLGFKVPKFVFVPAGRSPSATELRKLRTPEVVLKVVSPLIHHKTDVGGVRFCPNKIRDIKENLAWMLQEIPQRWLSWAKAKGVLGAEGQPWSESNIRKAIKGFLVVEKVSFEKIGLGEELIFGLRQTRDFGPVVTVGLGGVDVEYIASRLKEDQSLGFFSAYLIKREKIVSTLERLAFYEKLVKGPRGGKPVISKEKLAQVIERLASLGRSLASLKRRKQLIIEELEANPVVVAAGELMPLDGLARFSRPLPTRLRPPVEPIGQLLRPQSIGLIGVSEKMNLGHIILNNILQAGFPQEKIFIVKPNCASIEGCRCYPSLAELPETVDLFIYALPAEQVYSCLQQIIQAQKARSMVIIAGGLGEKSGTQAEEQKIRQLLEEARRRGQLVPVVNGANCLGIISRPGLYDTTFIPEYKFPRPTSGRPGLVFISQSGAFMITRLNKSSVLAPYIAISVGNQIDLTVADYLGYFAQTPWPEVKVIALYLEGLREGDGIILAKAAAKLIRDGKRIIVYKGGRTPEGQAATVSHTASIAGDYSIFKNLLSQVGVYVADTLAEFETGMRALFHLANKKVRGPRVGLVSNAGFECVIMADNVEPEKGLKPARWSSRTRQRFLSALSPLGIEKLQDIRNPLDLTPVADDAAFAACVEAVLDDPKVDCAVISPVPMTPALQTLPAGDKHTEDFRQPSSLASRLVELFERSAKPVVFCLDAGALYDPLADYLESCGLPVFRRVDEALLFLKKLVRL